MSTSYSPKIVTDGLVLALDAANRKSYPGSGTSWIDLSGNNNSGSLTNGPTFNSEAGGNIVFDGTNDFVTGSFNGSVQLTVAAWIKPVSYHASPQTIASGVTRAGELGPVTFWELNFLDISGDIHFRGAGSGVTPVPLNIWTFAVGTTTGSADQVFINGVYAGAGTSSTLLVGRSTLRIGDLFSGSIANVQVYNRVLSANEVLQNFNATRGRFGV
jgi:hypothetical protein